MQQRPTFGIFAGLAEGECAMELACVCKQTGFVFLAAVEGAISKICSGPDQKGEVHSTHMIFNSR